MHVNSKLIGLRKYHWELIAQSTLILPNSTNSSTSSWVSSFCQIENWSIFPHSARTLFPSFIFVVCQLPILHIPGTILLKEKGSRSA